MLMGGTVVTSCSLHVLLSTCGVYPWLCARERGRKQTVLVREGNKNRQFFYGYTCFTYVQNRHRTGKPGKSYYPLPSEKKNFENTPRELHCSDRAQTSTPGSGRTPCVDVLSVLAKSACTKRCCPEMTDVSQIYVCV